MSPIYCHNCGIQIDETFAFCKKCGADQRRGFQQPIFFFMPLPFAMVLDPTAVKELNKIVRLMGMIGSVIFCLGGLAEIAAAVYVFSVGPREASSVFGITDQSEIYPSFIGILIFGVIQSIVSLVCFHFVARKFKIHTS